MAREAFGFDALRPGQREAIEAVLAGRDTLVVMSTGSGKSAIYQIAGLLTPGATVVVSPLIALQRDQVEDLAERAAGGAAQLNSHVPAAERDAGARRARRGRARVPLPRPGAARQPRRARRAGRRAARRCWSSTRRTASPSGATTSGPTTCGSAPPPRRSGARPILALTATARAAGARRDRRAARAARPRGDHPRLRPPEHPPRASSASTARAAGSASCARCAERIAARPAARDRLRRHPQAGRGARRRRCARAACAPPPTTPGMKGAERDAVQERFMDGDARRRVRHHRVRHGHRQGRRALGDAQRDLRVARRLLPGGRPRRARRRARRGGAVLPQRGPRAAAVLLRHRARRGRRDRPGARARCASTTGPVEPGRAAGGDRPLADQAHRPRCRGSRRPARVEVLPDRRGRARRRRPGRRRRRSAPPPWPRRSAARSTARGWT